MSDDSRAAGGLAAVVAAAFAFSWGFVIVKSIPLSPAALAFWRSVVGAGALAIAALVLKIAWPKPSRVVIIAGVAFGAHQLLYIAAVQRTSIAIVVLVGATLPLCVSLVSRRSVGEKASMALVGWTLIAMIGIAIVMWANLDDPTRSLTGDILAAVNIVAFTGYFMAIKRARLGGAPTVTLTSTALGIAAVVAFPALFFSERAVPAGPVDFGLIALLALGPGNGHLLLNWAHARVRAALSSLALTATPILATVWAHLVLHEPLGPRHIAGMALVVVAIEGGRRADAATGSH